MAIKLVSALSTPQFIQFQNSSGQNTGKIETSGDDLIITNAVGDVLFGDGASDIYIGDGVNSVDILFEQSGAIRGEGSVTLTLGSSNTTLNVYNPQMANGMTLTSTMTMGTGAVIDFLPDTGAIINLDGQTILKRNTFNGGITLGHDDAVIIAGGDTYNTLESNISLGAETVFLGAEGGVTIYAFPNNDTAWSNRKEFIFSNDTNFYLDGRVYPSNQATNYVDSTRIANWNQAYGWGDHSDGGYLTSVNNSSWSGTDLAIANGGTGASSASAARTNLGLGSAATSASTDFVAVTGDSMTGTLTLAKESQHVSQGSISASNAHLDLYNTWQSDTDQKGSIITFTDNYYGSGTYNKTLRAAIKGGTDTTGNTADGYLEFYTDSAGANSPNIVLRLDKNRNASFYGNVTASGNVTGTNLNISNWNTAYGWGDHGAQGYLTSVSNANWSGTDLSIANGGTGASTASNARTNLGLGTAATSAATDFVAVTGDTVTGNIIFNDNVQARFGSGSDLRIYHDGSNSYMSDTGTGNMYLNAADNMYFQVYATGERWITLTKDAGVQLFYNDVEKFQTQSTGTKTYGVHSIEYNGVALDIENSASSGADTGVRIRGARNGQSYATDNLTSYILLSNFDDNTTPNNYDLVKIGGGMYDANSDTGYFRIETNNGTALTKALDIDKNQDAKFYGDVDADGNITASNLNISNWNTAYGWGNHASAGYLTTSTAATTYAPLASPALTGTPTAPTAGSTTNTTQIATTAFVQTAVSNLVDSAPAALDTLNELAAALGDDANFSTTMSTALGNRLRVDTASQGLTSTQKSNARTNLGLGTAATSADTDFVSSSGNDAIIHATDQKGLGIYTSGGGQPTTHQLQLGRSSSQYWGARVDDTTAYLVHRQDETDATTHGTRFEIWSSSSGEASWAWSKAASDGASQALKMKLNDSGQLTLGGGTNTITNTKVGQWDTAYGWGNHASAGYSTASGVEDNADVTDTANVVAALTAGTNVQIAANGTISATDTNTQLTTAQVRGKISGTGLIGYNSSTGVISTTADNYGSWNLKTGGTQRTTVGSAGTLDIIGGTNVSVSYASGGRVTISSTDTNTQLTDAQVRSKISGTGLISYNSSTGVISTTANNYSLPAGSSSTRGGFKIGYAENGKNYPVEVSSEKMYVNVPWTDTNTDTVTSVGVSGSETTGTITLTGAGATTITQSGGAIEIRSTDTNTTYSVGDGGLTQKNFTTTLKNKLDGIEASANVTDTANVSAAGALMRSGGTMTGDFTITSGDSNGMFIGSGGANLTSVTPSSKDVILQDVGEFRFGGASWDWNAWAGLKFDDSNEILYIGGPAASQFSSNSNPPIIDVNFVGVDEVQLGGNPLATQEYVNTAVSNVVASAPAALDTLNELAAALGDDASFSTTVSTSLGNRLRIDTASQGLTSTQKSNGRTNLGLGTLATLSTVNAATITNNSVGAAELNVSGNGSSGQVLTSDGDGTMTWTNKTANTDTITSVGVSGSETAGTITLTGAGATTITQSGGGIEIRSTDTNTTYSVGDGGLTQKNFTTALKTKLDGIAAGATNVTNNNQLINGAGYVTSSGNTVIGTDSDINTSGSTIIDNIYVTDGVITSMGTRTLTPADIGAGYYDHIRSIGTTAFTNGSNPNITTAQVMSEIESDGGFDSYTSVFKTSWSYAGNYNLTDAGNFTETAGSSWITWTDNSSDSTRGNITALAIAPNTGGSAGGVFIYNDQGSSYAPGWREVWTSSNFADNSSNWNTAYGWGNHASAGYSTASGVEDNANNYSLPAGSSSTRGGFKIGYTESGKNYPVEVSSEKMFVNVPWTDTQLTTTQVRSKFSAGSNVSITNGTISATNTDTVTSVGVSGSETTGTITLTAAGATTLTQSGGTIEIRSTDTNTTYTVGDGGLTQKNFTTTLKTKLDGIAAGATNVTNNNQLTNGAGYITSVPTTLSGNRTIGGDLTVSGNQVITAGSNADVKFSVWSGTTYGIGMTSGVTYGGLNDYAMTFCMNNDSDRGFWWGYSGQSKSSGAMSLTTSGNLTLAGNASISGTISASGYNDSNWNTAYSWGNHASAGYSTAANVEDNADVTDTANVVAALTAGSNIQIAANGTISATDTNTTYSVGDGGLTQKNFTSTLKTKLDGIAASANNYSLPAGSSSVRGGFKIGYAENGKNYPVEVSSEKMFVNVPWTDTNTTYTVGDGGLTQKNFTTTLKTKLDGIASGADLYIGWNFVDTSDTATRIDSQEYFKIAGANITGTGTSNDPYLVNTPDTNTTYTADGNYGMTLSGTAFRLENDRRRNSTTQDIYTGNTHDYTFYDADIGIRWYTAGAEEMRLEDDGDLHVDGDVIAFSTTVSDARLKDDVQTIENATEKVNQLRGVSYTWNEGSRKGQREIGVIAQEVQEVVPEVVHEKKLPLVDNETYKTVDYEKLVALLIESNKELAARVETLEAKLDGITK